MNKPEGKANTIWRIQFNRDFNTLQNWDIIQKQVAQVVRTIDDHFDSWVDANRNDPHYPHFFEEYSTMRNHLHLLDGEKDDALEMLNILYDNISCDLDIEATEWNVIQTLQPIIDGYNEALNLM